MSNLKSRYSSLVILSYLYYRGEEYDATFEIAHIKVSWHKTVILFNWRLTVRPSW